MGAAGAPEGAAAPEKRMPKRRGLCSRVLFLEIQKNQERNFNIHGYETHAMQHRKRTRWARCRLAGYWLNMAVPMMISMLVQALYNVVDSVFVARLSENALNAVSLAFPLQNLMIAVGAGTAVGINALLSRSLGEKKQDMADRAAGTGMFLLPVCSFVVFAADRTVPLPPLLPGAGQERAGDRGIRRAIHAGSAWDCSIGTFQPVLL